MSRLEVDVKSIQKVIRDRAVKAQKTLVRFEEQAEKTVRELISKGLKSRKEGQKQVEQLVQDVRQTVSSSPLVKNLKKTSLYHTALKAKDGLRTRASEAQERVFNLLNVPTKRDLDRLDQKVERLTKKLKTEQKEKGRKTAEAKTE